MGVCEKNACTDGNCVESVMPSTMDGRSEEEIRVLADIIKRFKEKEQLDRDEKDVIDHLTDEDIHRIDPDARHGDDDIVNVDGEDGPFRGRSENGGYRRG